MSDFNLELDRDVSVHRSLVERIRARMVELKTNARQVSKKSGLGLTAVSDILSGKVQRPSITVVQAIADELDCDLPYLIGTQDNHRVRVAATLGIEPIPVVGAVEAGAFRTIASSPEGEPFVQPTVLAAPSRAHPKAKRFAYEVRGKSMDALQPAPILPGMLVFCIDMEDAKLELASGEIYVVRRTMDGGQTYEFSIRRATIYMDRVEYTCELTDPRLGPILIPHGTATSDGYEVLVLGLVYGWFFSNE